MGAFDFGTELGTMFGAAESGLSKMGPLASDINIGSLAGEAVPNLAADFGSQLGTMGRLNLSPSAVPNIASTSGSIDPSIANWGSQIASDVPTGGSFLNTVGEYAKPVSAVLGGMGAAAQIPLGLMSLNIARQGQKAQQAGIQQAEAAAAPQIAAEQKLLPAGTDALMTGQLPPELQQQVDTQMAQTKAALLQNLSSAGIAPDTAEAMIAGQLAQLKNQLTMQAAQSLLTGGGGVAGGGTTAIQAGQLGGTSANNANQALQNANQSLTRAIAAGG
jgi:hypothetical protein